MQLPIKDELHQDLQTAECDRGRTLDAVLEAAIQAIGQHIPHFQLVDLRPLQGGSRA
ncbi:hypothetical protein SAMN00790413_03582 [Deinococcus hopiensis KR-140]|uniref:Uncharacterized protein n=1 Tax=Deinococcus hopiensis KR-140 TaxID=695939 RepID=A0A1W1UXP7_9DEIO|nr:hypothetical protein SAMN00790413_03582 [Deinococcus hopiensis KR-140]